MFHWRDITNIGDGVALVQWFCDVYPAGPRMAADTCLDYEMGKPSKIIEGCPMGYYLDDPAWRYYLLDSVVSYYGKVDINWDNLSLVELYLWRFVASRHPGWVPEWTPEWENFYIDCYSRKKEKLHGAAAEARGSNFLTTGSEYATR